MGVRLETAPAFPRQKETTGQEERGTAHRAAFGEKLYLQTRGARVRDYRFHLQFEAYNLFIAKAAKPGKSPNVYLSISAKTLWLDGIEKALSWITEDLKAIGKGTILFVQVSRVDLCADFWIPGGLSHEFLLSHKATRTDKRQSLPG